MIYLAAIIIGGTAGAFTVGAGVAWSLTHGKAHI